MDHCPYMAESCRQHVEFDMLVKNRTQGIIPLAPISKSLWTCSVESSMEYCRIMYDIFPFKSWWVWSTKKIKIWGSVLNCLLHFWYMNFVINLSYCLFATLKMWYIELPFGINMLRVFNEANNNNNSLQLRALFMCFIFINSYDSHNSPMQLL